MYYARSMRFVDKRRHKILEICTIKSYLIYSISITIDLYLSSFSHRESTYEFLNVSENTLLGPWQWFVILTFAMCLCMCNCMVFATHVDLGFDTKWGKSLSNLYFLIILWMYSICFICLLFFLLVGYCFN